MDRRTATDACGAGHYFTYGLMLCSLQYNARVAGVVPSGSSTFRRVADNVLVDLTQWPFSRVRVLRSVAHCQYGIAMTVKMYRMMSFRNAVSTVVVQYHHLTINTLTHINAHKLYLILLSAFSVLVAEMSIPVIRNTKMSVESYGRLFPVYTQWCYHASCTKT